MTVPPPSVTPTGQQATATDLNNAAALFKQLGNEARLRILLHLAANPTSVTDLAATLGISQPLVSQHLRTLRDKALVTASKQGKTVTYRLADHHVAHIICDALAHAAETASPHPKGTRND